MSCRKQSLCLEKQPARFLEKKIFFSEINKVRIFFFRLGKKQSTDSWEKKGKNIDTQLFIISLSHIRKMAFIKPQDAMLFLAKHASQYGPMSAEAERAIHDYTAVLMKNKLLKATPYSRPKPNLGPGTLSEMFTEYVGSDRYGYIVKSVSNYGRVIEATGYDTVKGELMDVKGDICLKWHPRLDQGRGLWVRMGEKDQRKGPYYCFGAAQNYLDPSF